MKLLEVVVNMELFVFKECKFPRIFYKMAAKTQLSEITVKVYVTKRKNASSV